MVNSLSKDDGDSEPGYFISVNSLHATEKGSGILTEPYSNWILMPAIIKVSAVGKAPIPPTKRTIFDSSPQDAFTVK